MNLRTNFELFCNLTLAQLKIKYKNSLFGFMWVLLEPLAISITLYAVFTTLFKSDQINYGAYILVGYTAWFFFSNVNSLTTVLLENKSLITKTIFPRELILFSACSALFINTCFNFIVLFLILFFIAPISIYALFLPLLLIINFIFILGVALALSSLYIIFRDVNRIWNIFLQILFFATPIVYPSSLILKISPLLITLNPVYYFIKEYRNIILYNKTLSLDYAIILITIALATFIIGWAIFKRLEHRFAEEV
jgi:lipopolysaccharide transport system permease protein